MTSPLAAPHPWDLVAPAYAAELVPEFESFARAALELAAIAPPARVVDVACGPGTLTILAAREGHEVSALDFSPKMVAELRARIDSQGLASKVDVTPGDGMALPYADASFDAGFSMFGLMFFPDRGKGFRELLRVVKPGAPVVVSSWVPLDRVGFLAAAFAAMNDLLPPPPGAPPFKPPLAHAEECIAEMRDAGFRDVAVHEVTHQAAVAAIADGWASMVRTSAPFALRKAALGERWAAISSGILEKLRAKLGDGPLSMTMPALVTIGRK
ncbi:MAG: class I SAM-dependent methyltransferase [Polyangiaceae bacterium]